MSTTDSREAWNEVAATEGWCVYEPAPVGDATFEAYPICLECAEHHATTGEFRSPNTKKRRA